MSDEAVQSFDLQAAWLRKAQTDVFAFLGALAKRFEEALPHQVVVHRKRLGLFSRESRVERVSVQADTAHYDIFLDGANALRCSRAKVVSGVTLKTEMLDIGPWLAQLEEELSNMARRAGASQTILHDFLLS